MAFSDDMIVYVNKLKKGEDINPQKWNINSKIIQDSLVTLYDFPELNTVSEQMDSVFTMITIKYRFADILDSEIDKMSETFKQNRINQYSTYARFYKLLFDEPLIPTEL